MPFTTECRALSANVVIHPVGECEVERDVL
jgi:hypothetical protein